MEIVVPMPLNSVASGLFASMILISSACSGSAPNSADGEATQTTEFKSPLFEFLGIDPNLTNADNQAKQAQIERVTQEKIAACMRAEGFDYTPTSSGPVQAFSPGDEDGLEWGSKAWAEKYGFGVSTQLYAQEDVGPDLVGHNFGSFFPSDGTQKDPNEAYAESLPEGDQLAYYAALYGNATGPEFDPSLSEEENATLMNEYLSQDYEPTGCAGTAYDQAASELDGGFEKFYEEFGDQLEELEQRFEADPRVVQVRAKIAACVADKGYNYTNEEAAYEDLQDRVSDIAGGIGGGIVIAQDQNLTDEEYDASALDQFKLKDKDREKLKAAQEYEIGLALAVVDCSGGSLSPENTPELNNVRVEFEQEFLDTNRDALSQFKGATG